MSVATLTESRVYDRGLEYSRDAILPGIKENAFDMCPLVSALAGRLNVAMFGPSPIGMRGKNMLNGGTTIQGTVNLGANTTIKTLASSYDNVDTTPSDTPRHYRANIKQYTGTINIPKFEELANRGPQATANQISTETTLCINSLVTQVGLDLYSNGGDATKVTDLQTIVAANNTLQILSGATYLRWNSRGISPRGTAPSSISFTCGSFSAAGIQNMRLAYLNCAEGAERPDLITTQHAVFSYYEGSLQPQIRYEDTSVGNAKFESLRFGPCPVIPDPQCNSGEMYFLNLGHYNLNVMDGADFMAMPFVDAQDSLVRVSKVIFFANATTDNRFLLNKLVTITA